MAKNETLNCQKRVEVEQSSYNREHPVAFGQKRVEVEQSSYNREHPVAFGQKREKVGVGQSDIANNTLCRFCFQVHPFLAIAPPKTSRGHKVEKHHPEVKNTRRALYTKIKR